MTPVRLEPAAPRSQVKHSTTEPLHSQLARTYKNGLSLYSKTCFKGPLKNTQNKGLKDKSSLMNVKNIAEYSLEAFCNTFDLH